MIDTATHQDGPHADDIPASRWALAAHPDTQLIGIPADASSQTLAEAANAELRAIRRGGVGRPANRRPAFLAEELSNLVAGHTTSDELETVLDWAAQVRIGSDLTWGEALRVATTWYYG